jgi:hypothetical protein
MVMLRTSGLLAIALSIAALGSVASPAAASSHASTTLKPLEVQAGQLPLPPRVPKLRPPYCAVHNCLMPARPGG